MIFLLSFFITMPLKCSLFDIYVRVGNYLLTVCRFFVIFLTF